MAFTLPLPVRVAAGILATGIERVRALPDDIPALPVTLVGNAMRLTMKVQQEIATLATRGDELLGGVIAAPQENPSWARFDDDEPAPSRTASASPRPVRDATERETSAPNPATGKSGSAKPKKPNHVVPQVHPHPEDGGDAPAPVTSATEKVRVTADGTNAADAAYAVDEAVSADTASTDTATTATATSDAATVSAADTATTDPDPVTLTTPDATSMPPITTTAMEAAIEVPESLLELAIEATEPPVVAESDAGDGSEAGDESEAVPTATLDIAVEVAELDLTDAAPDTVVFEETEELTEQIEVPEGLLEEVEEAADGPAALPGYDVMTLAQVRGHLRDLSADEVTALLDYERLADNRAPFLTLLSNRLVTLDAQHP